MLRRHTHGSTNFTGHLEQVSGGSRGRYSMPASSPCVEGAHRIALERPEDMRQLTLGQIRRQALQVQGRTCVWWKLCRIHPLQIARKFKWQQRKVDSVLIDRILIDSNLEFDRYNLVQIIWGASQEPVRTCVIAIKLGPHLNGCPQDLRSHRYGTLCDETIWPITCCDDSIRLSGSIAPTLKINNVMMPG